MVVATSHTTLEQSRLVEEEYSGERNALPRTQAAAMEEELGA